MRLARLPASKNETTNQNMNTPNINTSTTEVFAGSVNDAGNPVEEPRTVKNTEPTLKEITDLVGEARSAEFITDALNRHHLLPQVRQAYKSVNVTPTAKTDDGKVKELEKAKALIARVEDGEVFNILDFVPKKRAETDWRATLATKVGKLRAGGKKEEADALIAALSAEDKKSYVAFVKALYS